MCTWNSCMATAGGTFALYALLCRHLKLSLILNQQAADEELSAYKSEQPSTESPRGVWFRRLLDKHKFLRNGLLIVVLLGTCMVIGDGALTPALSGTKFISYTLCNWGSVPLSSTLIFHSGKIMISLLPHVCMFPVHVCVQLRKFPKRSHYCITVFLKMLKIVNGLPFLGHDLKICSGVMH